MGIQFVKFSAGNVKCYDNFVYIHMVGENKSKMVGFIKAGIFHFVRYHFGN